MPHNGGKLQLNFWFLNSQKEWPFINLIKGGLQWGLTDGSGAVPVPTNLNSNYYPIAGGSGVYTAFNKPPEADRPGNWIMDWIGDGTIRRNFTNSIVSGSASGVNGRCVMSTSATFIDCGIASFNASNPITQLRFYHEDDEELINAGEVFSPVFKQKLIDGGFGVLRFLDWQDANTSSVRHWADRTPIDFAMYGGYDYRTDLYAGETTNSGDDYSVSAPPGWAGLVDKAAVIVRFNASSASATCTLDVGGTGAVPIRGPYGSTFFSTEWPFATRYALLVYDADLNRWLKFGGDVAALNRGIQNSVPIELMLRLCKEVGAHPWFLQPFLTADPPTDFMPSLASFVDDYVQEEAPWMVPRYELVGNEQWNTAAGFYASRYGWEKAQQRWGVGNGFDATHNYQGRAFSLTGQAIWDALGSTGKEPDRYHLICGVQTSGSASASASNARLASTRHVADGGVAASTFATHVAMANYWTPSIASDVTAELALAHEYDAADAEGKAEILANYIQSDNGTGFAPSAVAQHVINWKAWAAGFGAELCAYEGDYTPDYPANNNAAAITAITKAAQAVVTINGTVYPPIGSEVSFSGVAGMTEINTLTGEVVSRTGQNVTVDIDSSAFSNYTSAGTMTYVDSRTLRIALRSASKEAPELEDEALRVTQLCAALGLQYPSIYVLSGTGNAWPMLDPNIYAESLRFNACVRYRAKEGLPLRVNLTAS